MALPKITTPTFTTKVRAKTYSYSLLNKKEEKALLYVSETDSITNRINVISDIIESKTNGKVDPRASEKALVEYLFLKIRSESIDTVIEFNISSKNEDETTTEIPCSIDLSTLKFIDTEKPFESIVDISEFTPEGKTTVQFHSPTIWDYDIDPGHEEESFIYNCIDKIYIGDESMTKDDIDFEEFVAWLEDFTSEPYQLMTENLQNVPKVECEMMIGDKLERLHDIVNFLIFK